MKNEIFVSLELHNAKKVCYILSDIINLVSKFKINDMLKAEVISDCAKIRRIFLEKIKLVEAQAKLKGGEKR